MMNKKGLLPLSTIILAIVIIVILLVMIFSGDSNQHKETAEENSVEQKATSIYSQSNCSRICFDEFKEINYSFITCLETCQREYFTGLNGVFVDVNFDNTNSMVRCHYDEYQLSFKMDYQFFVIIDKETFYEERGNSVYRIRMPILDENYDDIENTKEFLKYTRNKTKVPDYIDEIHCRADILYPENNVTAELWDEGNSEIKDIDLFWHLRFKCYSDYGSERWECIDYSLEGDEASYFSWKYLDQITDGIIGDVLE